MKSNHSITIISLNTNLVARSWIPLPDRTTRDHLDRLIKHGSEDLPMLPGYFATLSLAHGCAQLLISRRGRQLLTAGLAWANHDSADLWRCLLDFREARCCQQRNSKGHPHAPATALYLAGDALPASGRSAPAP